MSDTTTPPLLLSILPLPIALVSSSLKPISLQLASTSTSCPFHANPPFYFVFIAFLSKLVEKHV